MWLPTDLSKVLCVSTYHWSWCLTCNHIGAERLLELEETLNSGAPVNSKTLKVDTFFWCPKVCLFVHDSLLHPAKQGDKQNWKKVEF